MTRRNATTRELVEELLALTEALDAVPAHRRDRISLQHHRRQVLRLARRLEKRTRPKPAPAPTLPGRGTVAWHVLELLEANRRGYDHDHVRMLTGLTDAELCVAIVGVGPNSVRPRRVELAARGLVVQASGRARRGDVARWTISDLGRQLLANAEAVRRAG